MLHSSLFIKHNDKRTTLAFVYVDDIILASSDSSKQLNKAFAVKVLVEVELQYFLAIEFKHDANGSLSFRDQVDLRSVIKDKDQRKLGLTKVKGLIF